MTDVSEKIYECQMRYIKMGNVRKDIAYQKRRPERMPGMHNFSWLTSQAWRAETATLS